MATKIVLKLDLHDDKDKQKALKAVSGLADLDAITVDMTAQKLTVVGGADPVAVASKLRKIWPSVQIVSVGPNKEEKKEGGGGGGDKKGDKPDLSKLVPYPYHYQYPYNYQYQYQQYPHYPQQYAVHSAEEDPNSCVIC